ncbi:MAG: YhdP family protein, partial [Burkholderiales bacterium]
SGSYLSNPAGKGNADLSGRLVRADARAMWRYIPRFAPNTQRWLKRALVRGSAEDVQFRLNGPLDRFPFRDGAGGRFEVVSKVRDVTLAYAPGWPAVEGIDATVAFRGASMEIEAAAGRTLGIEVGRTRASIPALGNRQEHLILEGQGSGSIADFLRFIEASPVAAYTNGITGKMRGAGTGRLRIDFDMPLHRARDVKLAGSFDFSARELQVDPRVPPLSEAQAIVEFSEKSVAIRDGRAWLHGSALDFSGSTQKDGAVVMALGGRIDAAGLQRSIGSEFARGIDGETEWKAGLAIRKGISTLWIESSLAGLALRMPPPLAKPPESALSFRLELLDQPGAGGQVSAALGDLGTARLALERGTISRGEVRFGGQAALPRREGLVLAGRIDAIDVDAWRKWLARGSQRNGASLSALDLSVGRLMLAGRKFQGMRLRGERAGGGWQLSLDSREAAGTLAWQDGETDRLSARFSTLLIPSLESEVRPKEAARGPGENLPGLDVIAENFVFEGKNLGRLELTASPAADSWQLERLAVSNPDGRLDVSGKWFFTEPPTTELEVRIEASDAGKLLARLGYNEGVMGAKGSLSGPVKWIGAPYRVDLA